MEVKVVNEFFEVMLLEVEALLLDIRGSEGFPSTGIYPELVCLSHLYKVKWSTGSVLKLQSQVADNQPSQYSWGPSVRTYPGEMQLCLPSNYSARVAYMDITVSVCHMA